MAFKRSAVRSLLSPPRDLEQEFRVFFFFAARPRFQRFHGFGGYNDLHEIAQGAFRGIVGIRGTVISLKSLEPWGSLYVRKSWKRWNRGAEPRPSQDLPPPQATRKKAACSHRPPWLFHFDGRPPCLPSAVSAAPTGRLTPAPRSAAVRQAGR